jgi:hypothetical protein
MSEADSRRCHLRRAAQSGPLVTTQHCNSVLREAQIDGGAGHAFECSKAPVLKEGGRGAVPTQRFELSGFVPRCVW